jgi:hypothetical protein
VTPEWPNKVCLRPTHHRPYEKFLCNIAPCRLVELDRRFHCCLFGNVLTFVPKPLLRNNGLHFLTPLLANNRFQQTFQQEELICGEKDGETDRHGQPIRCSSLTLDREQHLKPSSELVFKYRVRRKQHVLV